MSYFDREKEKNVLENTFNFSTIFLAKLVR